LDFNFSGGARRTLPGQAQAEITKLFVAPALLPVLCFVKKDASAQAGVPVPHDREDDRALP